ncbi:hypothetical protein [Priestia megaterium]|nr:hypothetical protein [Priestia megaterium]
MFQEVEILKAKKERFEKRLEELKEKKKKDNLSKEIKLSLIELFHFRC